MLEALVAFGFGLLIGSFLNVCIHRMPLDLSVVRPRSHCVNCKHTIAWYDNVPVLSYVLLGGRCRHCKAHISLRYPIVELLTAILFFVYVASKGPTLPAWKLCLFGAILIGLVFSDFEQRILPDEFTLGGTVAGLALAWFVPLPGLTARALLWMAGLHWSPRWTSVAEALLGAAIPTFCLWFGGYLYAKVRHREGLGLGDVKMMGMVGAFLGLQGALLTLIIGSVLGSVVGYLYILAARKDASSYELPFGTFLGIGGIAVTLIGTKLLTWYGSLY